MGFRRTSQGLRRDSGGLRKKWLWAASLNPVGREFSGVGTGSSLAGLSMDFGFLDSILGASYGKAFLKQSGVILRPATKCSYEGPERSALL